MIQLEFNWSLFKLKEHLFLKLILSPGKTLQSIPAPPQGPKICPGMLSFSTFFQFAISFLFREKLFAWDLSYLIPQKNQSDEWPFLRCFPLRGAFSVLRAAYSHSRDDDSQQHLQAAQCHLINLPGSYLDTRWPIIPHIPAVPLG